MLGDDDRPLTVWRALHTPEFYYLFLAAASPPPSPSPASVSRLGGRSPVGRRAVDLVAAQVHGLVAPSPARRRRARVVADRCVVEVQRPGDRPRGVLVGAVARCLWL
jgi:hypothetical protein